MQKSDDERCLQKFRKELICEILRLDHLKFKSRQRGG